jgi:hypothetical protein
MLGPAGASRVATAGTFSVGVSDSARGTAVTNRFAMPDGGFAAKFYGATDRTHSGAPAFDSQTLHGDLFDLNFWYGLLTAKFRFQGVQKLRDVVPSKRLPEFSAARIGPKHTR